MTIEFRCTSCDKLLRTPAGTEGKQAKCPDCGMLMTIPATSAFSPPPREPDFRASEPEPSSQPSASRPREPEIRPRESAFSSATGPAAPRDSGNPFQSPSVASMERQWHAARRGFQPTQIEFGDTFDRAWQIYKANLGHLVGGFLLSFLTWFILMQIVQGVFGLRSGRYAVGLEFRLEPGPRFLMQLIGNVLVAAIVVFFWIGLIRFTTRIARGEQGPIADLFSAGTLFLPGLAVHFIVSIAATVGFFLCFLPGIWVVLALCFSLYALVDQGTGIVDSLKCSLQATRGNKLVLAGLWLAAIGLSAIVTLFTCGLGFVVVAPFVLMLMAVAYLGAAGQLGTDPQTAAPYIVPPAN